MSPAVRASRGALDFARRYDWLLWVLLPAFLCAILLDFVLGVRGMGDLVLIAVRTGIGFLVGYYVASLTHARGQASQEHIAEHNQALAAERILDLKAQLQEAEKMNRRCEEQLRQTYEKLQALQRQTPR